MNMKKKLFVILSVIFVSCFALNAQDVAFAGESEMSDGNRNVRIERRNYSLVYYDRGLPCNLTEDMVDAEFWKKYDKASALVFGVEYAMGFSLGYVLGDSLYYGIFKPQEFGQQMLVSLAVFGVMAVISTPFYVVGVKKLNGLAKDYNSQHSAKTPTISIGAQQYGFGVAINF